VQSGLDLSRVIDSHLYGRTHRTRETRVRAEDARAHFALPFDVELHVTNEG